MIATGTAADLLYAMQGLALARGLPIPASLAGLKVFAPLLDDLREDKALFVLHFVSPSDEAGEGPYVVSIGGGRLGQAPGITARDSSVSTAIARAVLEYAGRCWNFDW